MEAIGNARIYQIQKVPVRLLDGFEKHHVVPKNVDHRALKWLEELTYERMDSELQQVYSAIRSAYGLKRRQLSVFGPHDRRGVIETPNFNFELSVNLSQEDPGQVVWNRQVGQIRNTDQIVGPEFERCFQQSGWILEMDFVDALNLDEIVDRIEDQARDGFDVDYDKDVQWCEINIPDCEATLRATSNSFSISLGSNSTPPQLFRALIQFQIHLAGVIGLVNHQSMSLDS